MKVETQIHLNKFKPWPFQIPIIDAIENKGYTRVVAVLHRRAGKDVTAFNIMIRAALKQVGTYYYILPTYKQARLVLFEGKTHNGQNFLDFIPKEVIERINIQEMKIKLINSSIIYFVGSDNYDNLRGTNPRGIVFSEYAYQHPSVYPTLRPILVANGGWAIFLSTPFGENHFYTLYETAKNSEDWYTLFLTVDDTGLVTPEQIEQERREGLISEDMIQQEYYCSFSVGAVGSYYAKYLVRMELNGQVGDVPWESGFKVHTAWDLGMRDQTTIIFFQTIGQTVRIIDLYQNSDVGLEHYINIVQNKPYNYGKHIGPHDIGVRDYSSGGRSRWDIANDLGIKFITAPDMSVIDGIESVRIALSKIWIDKAKCQSLLTALRDYRKEYDSARKTYKNHPLHDKNSHFADAMRYLCISLPKTKDGSSPEDLDRRYREAMYGDQGQLPAMFRDNEHY